MKKAGIVAFIAAAALTLSACSGGSSDSKKSDSDASATKVKAADYLHAKYDELKDGGTLTASIGEVGEQQNTFQQDGTAYTLAIWKWYNPQLALFEDDGTWKFNPAYFDDVTSEEKDGNTVVTFKVKKEASFNDGTPIDVTAFQTTWKANNGEDEAYQPSSTDGYQNIKSVEAGSDAKEVVVTFDGIYAWWQGLFNYVLHPAIDTADKYNTYYTTGNVEDYNKLGAGPYKLESFDVSSGVVTFVPNEKWWGNPGKLERVTFKAMEPSADINAFANGEIDAVSSATAERLAKVKAVSGAKIYTAMKPSNALLMLNAGTEALQDVKVRQAVMEGIDRTKIAAVAFQGLDYTEPLPGSFTLFASQEGYEDNFSKAAKHDVEGSKKLLDEAGWKPGADGIREKDGKKLSFNFPYFGDNPTVKARAQVIQAALKEVGIEVNIEQRAVQDFSKTYTNKDFDIFVIGFSSSDPFGVAYFGQIYASDSGLNLSGTGTEEFDKKIAELQKIGDPDEQIKAANELEVEAFKLYGIMPLFNGPGIAAVKDGLANFSGNVDNSMGFAIPAVETVGWVK